MHRHRVIITEYSPKVLYRDFEVFMNVLRENTVIEEEPAIVYVGEGQGKEVENGHNNDAGAGDYAGQRADRS